MGLRNVAGVPETVILPPVGSYNIQAPGDTEAETMRAPAGEDQVQAIRPKHMKESRQSRQNCQACQSSATEDITVCAICEYVAIYGRKALRTHSPLADQRMRRRGCEAFRATERSTSQGLRWSISSQGEEARTASIPLVLGRNLRLHHQGRDPLSWDGKMKH